MMRRHNGEHIKQKVTFSLLIISGVFGMLMVFYFSWIHSPKLSINNLVPLWLGSWADKHSNFNLRTAVPLCALGIVLSSLLALKKAKFKFWLSTWIVLTVLVCIAELGQLVLPLRVFDIADIFWGSLGAFIPLCLGYIIFKLCTKTINK